MAVIFKLKRSSISGVKPTTDDIASGELAINTADSKLFSSNGSVIFELGSNLSSIAVGNSTVQFTVNTTQIAIGNGLALVANGGTGTSGQVLTSNGVGIYWSTVTDNSATAYSNAVANAAALYQTMAGLSANVATLTSNNTSFVGSVSAANVVSNTQLQSNLANYQTTAGLAANVLTLSANAATYANASISNIFTVGSSVYFVSNGNVGLGNTAPAYKLRIQGDLSLSGGIHANGSLGTENQALFSNGTVAYWANVVGGAVLTANNTDTQTFYLPMSNTTTGTWSNGVVSDTKLNFVPSTGTLNATIFNSLSDATMKTDIQDIKYGLDTILNIDAKTFKFLDNPKQQIGLIAQNVGKYIPEAVTVDHNNKLTLNYDSLIAVLIEAIKELNKKLENKT